MEFKIKMSDNQFSNKSISMIADIEGDFTDMINTEMPSELPILPVRNIVLFPGVVWPILLGRASSMKLARQAEKNGEVIGVVCQRDPDIEVPTYDDLYEYGVSAKIVKQFTPVIPRISGISDETTSMVFPCLAMPMMSS